MEEKEVEYKYTLKTVWKSLKKKIAKKPTGYEIFFPTLWAPHCEVKS